MDLGHLDWLAILIAAALNMAINFVWYSKWLFGKECSQTSQTKEKPDYRGAVAWSMIVSLILAYFIAWFETNLGVTTVQDGLFVSFCLWLGFVATTQSYAVFWCKKPFHLFLIDTGNRLVAFLVMGGVLGA